MFLAFRERRADRDYRLSSRFEIRRDLENALMHRERGGGRERGGDFQRFREIVVSKKEGGEKKTVFS